MQLLNPELREQLPPLGGQRNAPDPTIYAMFYTIGALWAWYVAEGEAVGDDYRFFGFIAGESTCRWGHFLLSELEAIRSPQRLPVVRQEGFSPCPFSQVLADIRKYRLKPPC